MARKPARKNEHEKEKETELTPDEIADLLTGGCDNHGLSRNIALLLQACFREQEIPIARLPTANKILALGRGFCFGHNHSSGKPVQFQHHSSI